MCGGIARDFRPTPITAPSRCVIGTTAASHAIRRELSALTRTPVDLGAARFPVLLQRGHLGVDRHLVPLGTRPGFSTEPRRQRPFGDQSRRIGPALAAPWPHVGALGAVQRITRDFDRAHQHGPDLGLEPAPHHVHPVPVDGRPRTRGSGAGLLRP